MAEMMDIAGFYSDWNRNQLGEGGDIPPVWLLFSSHHQLMPVHTRHCFDLYTFPTPYTRTPEH